MTATSPTIPLPTAGSSPRGARQTADLPAGATEKDVKATYKDGVLEVRIPMKTAETTAAKVPVQRVS